MPLARSFCRLILNFCFRVGPFGQPLAKKKAEKALYSSKYIEKAPAHWLAKGTKTRKRL
jgi:hypothetical protein